MGLSVLPHVINNRGIFGAVQYLCRAGRFMLARMVPGKKYLDCAIWDGEYRMLLDIHDDGISRTLAVNGKREMQLRVLLEEELKPGMCVCDLGANIGYYAVWEALRVGESGKVYCIEPSPANFELLKKNIELNGFNDRMETFNLGAADREGEADFFLAEYSNLHTFMPDQFRCGDKSRKLLDGKTIKIPITTVSEFAKDKRRFDLIRMDVEGFEVEVINGMQKILDENPQFHPTVVFEAHFPKYDDEHHSMRDCLRKMFARGYRITKLSSNDDTKNQHFLELGYKPYQVIKTSDVHIQGLYSDIKNEDAEKLICDLGGVRDVVLKYSD